MSHENAEPGKIDNEISEEELTQVSGGLSEGQPLNEIERHVGIDIDAAIDPKKGDRTFVVVG